MELSPSLLGVGYIIGPKIASIMVAGGVLAYLVISPMIVFFGGELTVPLDPGTKLISAMKDGEIRNSYILYIGAGAVAAGGIFSMSPTDHLGLDSRSYVMVKIENGTWKYQQ
jgi:uncharacterized oligopeptide transporter (OPT) family protein